MKLAIIFNEKKISGKLTKFFTGEYAYHTAWVDEENGKMYDMHLIRRRRVWPGKYSDVKLYDIPEVTREFMERKLETDKNVYGWKDYILFGLRPILHLFGKSTINAGGVICSEMCNNDMIESGVITPWLRGDAPPSPADLYRWLESKNATN